MDYEQGDVIDLIVTKANLVFRAVCIKPFMTASELPKTERYKAYEDCPACGDTETTYHVGLGFYCHSCCLVWHNELGVSCLACGRHIEPDGGSTLHCSWCEQNWDIEVIKDAYELGDWQSQIDWSTPKGANK